ncbi:MAG: DUF2249 domain-containing protein [Opitutaceae bacterium]|nr:DUF2249 domain-containing protein [Opitutaceae bacterium]
MPLTVHELDVRPLLATGQPPIDAILSAIAALPSGAGLRLHAPFEPRPLYSKLASLGFEHSAEPQPDGTFLVQFTPISIPLDLRELEPPEPMQRTLEAAATLPPYARIVARTRFRPVHLLAMLAERGLTATCHEQPDRSWVNVIVHTTAAPTGSASP